MWSLKLASQMYVNSSLEQKNRRQVTNKARHTVHSRLLAADVMSYAVNALSRSMRSNLLKVFRKPSD